MVRILSFSLYGDIPVYLDGALANARSASSWYPGWVCRFYVGASVPAALCEQLEAAGAEVRRMNGPETPAATLWRFLPATEEDVSLLVSRDCDSRFSRRELDAVAAWLGSGSPFHIMRDHPAHRVPILAGMWGAAGKGLDLIRHALEQPLPPDVYGIDQFLLARYVYPHIRRTACIHDAYFCYDLCARSFPSPREDYGFVGEAMDSMSEPNREQRAEVRHADTSLAFRLRIKAGSLKDRLLRRGYWSVV